MNSPLCQTTSQIRGVVTSLILPPVGNIFDSPFSEFSSQNREIGVSAFDKARYSKRAPLGKALNVPHSKQNKVAFAKEIQPNCSQNSTPFFSLVADRIGGSFLA